MDLQPVARAPNKPLNPTPASAAALRGHVGCGAGYAKMHILDSFRISVLMLMFIALTSCQRESIDQLQTAEKRENTTTLEHIEMLSGEVTFTLEDGEALNKTYPDTFWIPPRENRENLVKGEIVKLIFNISDGKKTQGERMWVIVQSGDGTGYKGVLDNDPYCTDQIKAGLEISFEPRHVIDIYEVESSSSQEAEQGAPFDAHSATLHSRK